MDQEQIAIMNNIKRLYFEEKYEFDSGVIKFELRALKVKDKSFNEEEFIKQLKEYNPTPPSYYWGQNEEGGRTYIFDEQNGAVLSNKPYMTSERAKYILSNQSYGEFKKAFTDRLNKTTYEDGITKEESEFIKKLWDTMPGNTSFSDAVRKIANDRDFKPHEFYETLMVNKFNFLQADGDKKGLLLSLHSDCDVHIAINHGSIIFRDKISFEKAKEFVESYQGVKEDVVIDSNTTVEQLRQFADVDLDTFESLDFHIRSEYGLFSGHNYEGRLSDLKRDLTHHGINFTLTKAPKLKVDSSPIQAKEVIKFDPNDNTGSIALLCGGQKCANLVATGNMMQEVELKDVDRALLTDFLNKINEQGKFLNSSIDERGFLFDEEIVAPRVDDKIELSKDIFTMDTLAYFMNDFVTEKMDLRTVETSELETINDVYQKIKNEVEVSSSDFTKIDFESENFKLLDSTNKEKISNYINERSDAITKAALEQVDIDKNKDISTDLNM